MVHGLHEKKYDALVGCRPINQPPARSRRQPKVGTHAGLAVQKFAVLLLC
jgi:hypothetical protein